jgi:hypothetical protein
MRAPARRRPSRAREPLQTRTGNGLARAGRPAFSDRLTATGLRGIFGARPAFASARPAPATAFPGSREPRTPVASDVFAGYPPPACPSRRNLKPPGGAGPHGPPGAWPPKTLCSPRRPQASPKPRSFSAPPPARRAPARLPSPTDGGGFRYPASKRRHPNKKRKSPPP